MLTQDERRTEDTLAAVEKKLTAVSINKESKKAADKIRDIISKMRQPVTIYGGGRQSPRKSFHRKDQAALVQPDPLITKKTRLSSPQRSPSEGAKSLRVASATEPDMRQLGREVRAAIEKQERLVAEVQLAQSGVRRAGKDPLQEEEVAARHARERTRQAGHSVDEKQASHSIIFPIF